MHHDQSIDYKEVMVSYVLAKKEISFPSLSSPPLFTPSLFFFFSLFPLSDIRDKHSNFGTIQWIFCLTLESCERLGDIFIATLFVED